MAKELEINVENLEYGYQAFQQIAECKPYSSYSFLLDVRTSIAFGDVRNLVEWGMGGNMPKMKIAALEILDTILSSSPGENVNLNFTEYECKSMQAVASLIERALEKQSNGVLRK